MILISIHPFAFKKLFLLVVAFLCVSSALCFADSVFMARQYAPDQHHRSTHVSSRPGETSDSARTVSLNSDTAESRSFEGVWAGVSAQIAMAAETSSGEPSDCCTNDYAMGLRSVDTEDSFSRTLAERQIFLF